MHKGAHNFIKYTISELETYAALDSSCVHKVTDKNLHVLLPPYVLKDFQSSFRRFIDRNKLGFYDVNLNGIILDMKNIKVSGTYPVRFDDPRLHCDYSADIYFFRPVIGATVKGVVKHIGLHYVGAVIYRVFNVSVRLDMQITPDIAQKNQELEFRIVNFEINDKFPYIEAELLNQSDEGMMLMSPRKIKKERLSDEWKGSKKTRFADSSDSEENEVSNCDALVKQEPPSEPETPKKSPARKRTPKKLSSPPPRVKNEAQTNSEDDKMDDDDELE